ncbi:MAG: amidophosphoribosyltransferase [Anaerovoracaceae bacterium]
MGGIFGAVKKNDCVLDIFFGTDYHSHLGTKNGGMCILQENGFNRSIHSISNTPFRTRFEEELEEMKGNSGIGAISDGDPQPLTVRNDKGNWAICSVGRINNKEELVKELLRGGHGHFMTMSHDKINNTELVASLVSTGKDVVDGIKIAQEKIDGSVTMLILTEEGLYAARDKLGRTPLIIGESEDGICAASESFAYINIGYSYKRELGPGEIAFLTAEEEKTVSQPKEKTRTCAFMWSYFGYTTSIYEGKNVEFVRNQNGRELAKRDIAEDLEKLNVDYIAGVPDSGIAHALGYANESKIPYSRPLIKYTPTWPRSFMPQVQTDRKLIAKMKLVPVFKIINGKKFILIDDSIVRGTQLSETVQYLKENGAEKIHVRSACPPIMFPCKYLNFSRSVTERELLTNRTIRELENFEGEEIPREILKKYADSNSQEHMNMVEKMRETMGFDSLKFQKLEDFETALKIDRCKLCTYCWNGEE